MSEFASLARPVQLAVAREVVRGEAPFDVDGWQFVVVGGERFVRSGTPLPGRLQAVAHRGAVRIRFVDDDLVDQAVVLDEVHTRPSGRAWAIVLSGWDAEALFELADVRWAGERAFDPLEAEALVIVHDPTGARDVLGDVDGELRLAHRTRGGRVLWHPSADPRDLFAHVLARVRHGRAVSVRGERLEGEQQAVRERILEVFERELGAWAVPSELVELDPTSPAAWEIHPALASWWWTPEATPASRRWLTLEERRFLERVEVEG